MLMLPWILWWKGIRLKCLHALMSFMCNMMLNCCLRLHLNRTKYKIIFEFPFVKSYSILTCSLFWTNFLLSFFIPHFNLYLAWILLEEFTWCVLFFFILFCSAFPSSFKVCRLLFIYLFLQWEYTYLVPKSCPSLNVLVFHYMFTFNLVFLLILSKSSHSIEVNPLLIYLWLFLSLLLH